jgi:predicted transcriptional regulator
MDTALERIRAKITELEEKLASLRIAERELLALDKKSARKAPATRESNTEPTASEIVPADALRQTISGTITEVLAQHGPLSVKEISELITSLGRDINNRAISFSLQAMKKRGLVKSADGVWKLVGRRVKRA